MDPDDDPLGGLRGAVQDVIADNALSLGQLPAGDGPANAPTNDCEFNFVGGAGTGGPYLESFRKALEKAGIRHVNARNQGGQAGRPQDDAPFYRVIPDLAAVPMINDLDFAKSLVGDPAYKAAAEHSRSLGNEQYNLGGYSYGAAAQAANAYAIAENGGKVDNLVLLGAPINEDLYDAVRTHPNIKNVITLDLGQYGDPVHAGMTDDEFRNVFPKLMGRFGTQLYGHRSTGHFYYSGADAVGTGGGRRWRGPWSRRAFANPERHSLEVHFLFR
jgi:hypothetical protein